MKYAMEKHESMENDVNWILNNAFFTFRDTIVTKKQIHRISRP